MRRALGLVSGLLIIVLSILNTSCGIEPIQIPPDEEGTEADWLKVEIHTPFGDARGGKVWVYLITENGDIRLTQDNWDTYFPDSVSRPYMTWYLINVYSDRDNEVHYDSIFEQASGYDMWEWYPEISKKLGIQWGTWYFRVKLSYQDYDSGGAYYQYSPTGIRLYRVSMAYDYSCAATETAETYIRVPYVYGEHLDENGAMTGKNHISGYFGIDCSGLVGYAYNALGANLDIGSTCTWVLKDSFAIANSNTDEWWNSVVEGDIIFVRPHGSGSEHVMYVGPELPCGDHTVHVLIHATAARRVQHETDSTMFFWKHNRERSVVIEQKWFRKSWWDNTPVEYRRIGEFYAKDKQKGG